MRVGDVNKYMDARSCWTSSRNSKSKIYLFPRNPKVVPVVHRKEVELPFEDENCSPIAAKRHLLTPHKADMLQGEVTHMVKAGILRPLTSRHCARSVFVRKSSGEVRACRDFLRALDAQLKDDQGGLGHMGAMNYRIRGAKFVTVIYWPPRTCRCP